MASQSRVMDPQRSGGAETVELDVPIRPWAVDVTQPDVNDSRELTTFELSGGGGPLREIAGEVDTSETGASTQTVELTESTQRTLRVSNEDFPGGDAVAAPPSTASVYDREAARRVEELMLRQQLAEAEPVRSRWQVLKDNMSLGLSSLSQELNTGFTAWAIVTTAAVMFPGFEGLAFGVGAGVTLALAVSHYRRVKRIERENTGEGLLNRAVQEKRRDRLAAKLVGDMS